MFVSDDRMDCTHWHAKTENLFLHVPTDANVSKQRQIGETYLTTVSGRRPLGFEVDEVCLISETQHKWIAYHNLGQICVNIALNVRPNRN